MNRLTRDDILDRALNRIDSASLSQKDRPGGVISPNAMCLTWLQDGIDLFHRVFPWTGLITTSAVSLSTTTNTYALPADFSHDVRDGLRIVQPSPKLNRRLRRKSLSWFLSQDSTSAEIGCPGAYTIIGTNLRVWQWPDTSYAGEFWYYKLPPALGPGDRPNFPDDWTLIEFVHLCGKEWTTEKEPGTSIAYANTMIAALRKSGLGEESENDALELDASFWRPSGSGRADVGAWMGETIPR